MVEQMYGKVEAPLPQNRINFPPSHECSVLQTHSSDTLNSDFYPVNRTVKSLIDELVQLLDLSPNASENYVLKLCDSEEYLRT